MVSNNFIKTAGFKNKSKKFIFFTFSISRLFHIRMSGTFYYLNQKSR